MLTGPPFVMANMLWLTNDGSKGSLQARAENTELKFPQYKLPRNSLVPDLVTAENWATCGYSAELLAVMTFSSWMTSISPEKPLGVWRLLTISLTEMPSEVKLLAVSRAPLTSNPLTEDTPATTPAMLLQPRPNTLSGNCVKSRAGLTLESEAVSVSSCPMPPATVTCSETCPSCSLASTRLIWLTSRTTLACT